MPEQSLRCDFCDGINVLMVTVKKLSWRRELLLYIGSKYYMLSFETSLVEIGLVFLKILNIFSEFYVNLVVAKTVFAATKFMQKFSKNA